jgi:hypothetical protein
MKILITEEQYKFLNEQSNFWGTVTSTVNGFIKNSWKVNPLSISYYFIKGKKYWSYRNKKKSWC